MVSIVDIKCIEKYTTCYIVYPNVFTAWRLEWIQFRLIAAGIYEIKILMNFSQSYCIHKLPFTNAIWMLSKSKFQFASHK